MDAFSLTSAASPKLLSLSEQPKLKSRSRPTRPSSYVTLPNAPYITHLSLLYSSTSSPSLAVASSDGALRAHDTSTLAPVNEAHWEAGGVVTSLTGARGREGTALFATQRGFLALWDPRLRSTDVALHLSTPHAGVPYLSCASHVNGSTLVAGTELKGYESYVDVFDIRNASRTTFSYTESHSDDVTALAFHYDAAHSHLLLSASTDGLVCVLDVRQEDEDEAVLGVSNTGASVARAGWGGTGARGASTRTAGAQPMNVDGLVGDEELEVRETRAHGMGGFWSISDMQTLSTWNEDFDPVLSSTDARQVRAFEWQTDYVIDAMDAPALAFGDDPQTEGLAMFVGTQGGRVALLQVDAEPEAQQVSPWRIVSMLPDSLAGTGGHSDIVRAVSWDASSRTLYTGGEDGQLSAWDMTASGASSGMELAMPVPLGVGAQDTAMVESPGAARRAGKVASRHTPY